MENQTAPSRAEKHEAARKARHFRSVMRNLDLDSTTARKRKAEDDDNEIIEEGANSSKRARIDNGKQSLRSHDYRNFS